MAGVSAVDPRVSFAELCQWPEDGRRYELYDGEVIVVPAPVPRHQVVALRIGRLLLDYAERVGGLALISPVDVVLTEHDVVQPDVVFFQAERRQLIKMWEAARVPPDLAVEVLSRSTERRDRGRKMELLARSGVPEYWIVDPAENVLEVYRLQGNSYVLAAVCRETDRVDSPTLPGLSFDARRVFEE
jgi:Uma2 family endonuclease